MTAESSRIILIVDDEPSIRIACAEALRAEGHAVLLAGSGEEALTASEGAAHIDLVVMDINLPDAWGAQLAQAIREFHPKIEVIYITGFAQDDEILRGGLNDAYRVLIKPFGMDELTTAVQSAL